MNSTTQMNFFNQFKNDLLNIIKEEEIEELFYYDYQKKKIVSLNLSNKYFNSLINYFTENLNIENL